MNRTRVVVLGGGYAGTMAANRLLAGPDIDVTVVNPRPAFVERIRLHQHVAGTYRADRSFNDVLGDGIRLIVDTAEAIDAADRRVQLASGTTLGYDYLVYAVGSSGAISAEVPGADEFAYPSVNSRPRSACWRGSTNCRPTPR